MKISFLLSLGALTSLVAAIVAHFFAPSAAETLGTMTFFLTFGALLTMRAGDRSKPPRP